jgi:subtilase family serine protease
MQAIPVSRPSFVPSAIRAVFTAILLSALMFCLPMQGQAAAQPAAVHPLITQTVDESQLTTLKGNTHPLARPQFDLGTAPASLPMQRMLLLLKRGPDQETALRKLLDDQQDKSSPSYHQWLTPEQYGQQFGPSDTDLQTITAWLQSHGFQVGSTKGRTVLEFSGTAGQVQEAFHTTMHKYIVNGEQHWANASDPQIPTALTGAVAGVLTLHNFLKKPQIHYSKEPVAAKLEPGKRPSMTFSDGTHGLGPYDYATIYHSPAFNGAINGATAIAIVGRSNLYSQNGSSADVLNFRNIFSLCCGSPQVVLNGPDPGDLGGGEEAEATLDTTWSGAVAPGASINLVVSASTDTTDGVDLSEVYIIENNNYDIMSESFGSCEALTTSTNAAGISALAEQAAAQGITYFVSTGDNGAEGCDDQNTETTATGPVSANVLASTAFNVAVGGTVFNENGQTSKYWNSTNSTTYESAVSYIPEDVWNDSCPPTTCGSNANIWAGSGGASIYIPKPSWQFGVTGIPSGGFRDLPDVSLTAASHDPYLVCLEGSCVPNSQGQFYIYFVWGTSASAPSFAGIMAMVEQQNGSRLGLANYVLYRLAATENLSQCNGSSASTLPNGTCIFNDVTVGNNSVPGEANYGLSSAQYQASTGYDQATGLGSVNITNLVNQWNTVTFNPTTTTLTTAQNQTVTHGSPVTVTVTVAPNSGSGVPTGDVSVANDVGAVDNFPVGTFTLSGGTATGTVYDLPGGYYSIYARYAGDATYAPSTGAGPFITVSPESSSTTLTASTFDAGGNFVTLSAGSSIPYGDLVYLHAAVAGASGRGTPTGTIAFDDNGAMLGNLYALSSDGSTVTPTGLFNLPAGASSLTAVYSSDYSFKGSTSSALTFSIVPAQTTVAVTPSATSIASGGSVTLTANLTLGTAALPSFGSAPTGTVAFFSNGTMIGSPQTVSGVAGSGNLMTGKYVLTTGTGSMTTTTLPNGQDSITAVYNGDPNYAVSPASLAVLVSVGGTPDFSLPTSGLGSVTISSPGGSGIVNLSITPLAGFTGAVTFTCVATSLPGETQCSQGMISAGQTTGTMTVSTMGPHAMIRPGYSGTWWAGGGAWLVGILAIGTSRGRRRNVMTCLTVLAAFVFLPACGGSGSGGGNHDRGTPAGSYTVSVTATSGSLTHSTSFALIVQ